MSKRYGLIIGSPAWVKVKEEEAAMEKKDSVLERFDKEWEKWGKWNSENQMPMTPHDFYKFIQSEIRKAKEEERLNTLKDIVTLRSGYVYDDYSSLYQQSGEIWKEYAETENKYLNKEIDLLKALGEGEK